LNHPKLPKENTEKGLTAVYFVFKCLWNIHRSLNQTKPPTGNTEKVLKAVYFVFKCLWRQTQEPESDKTP
jgi:G:T-mismatch repair DNA endonuclease (very short patch repair protein)